MAYRVGWWVEDQVVLLSLTRETSIEDFSAFATEIATRYLDDECAPVHVVLDMTGLERFPHQLSKIRSVVRELFVHPSLGKIVVVGQRVNPLASCIIDTLARTFRVECLRAATMDDALALVGRRSLIR